MDGITKYYTCQLLPNCHVCDPEMNYSKHDEKRLKMWEHFRVEEYVRGMQDDERQSLQNR